MPNLLIPTISFFIITIIFSLYMIRRIAGVGEYRKQLLNKISAACRNDIKGERAWEWRYDEFRKVSYDEMLLKFWKPLDKKFIEF